MEITEVRIALKDSLDKKLKAYATVTFDNVFVVRNIKVIEGTSSLFIAMPSRRVKQPCPKCGFKNELRSKYCNQCAGLLPQIIKTESSGVVNSASATGHRRTGANDLWSPQSEHKDIAHPITQSFREYLQKSVLDAYELERAKGHAGSALE
ncbi:MAG: septation protein SpoVG family protein [Candidatus Omnitrophota bacterium]|jgi:stage V sporulation protein G